jgi:hypothetical protein
MRSNLAAAGAAASAPTDAASSATKHVASSTAGGADQKSIVASRLPWWKRAHGYVKFWEAPLAVIALLFAINQFRDARHLDHDTEIALARLTQVTSQLADLADKTSTKYLGTFPNNMGAILEVASSPGRDLRILCDYPGYGHYSQPDDFDRYRKRLIAAVEGGVHVRMLYYSPDIARRMVTDQFSRNDWDAGKIQSRPAFVAYFKNHPGPGMPPNSYDDFVKALLDQQLQYEQVFCMHGIEIRHYDAPSALFFWVIDSKSGVFSINSRDEKGREETFFTRDGKLTDAYVSIFDRMWSEGQGTQVSCDTARSHSPTQAPR